MKALRVLAVIGIVGLAVSVMATPTLKLTEVGGGGAVVIIDDQSVIPGAVDNSPALGSIAWNGAVGANWTLNFTAALSKPASGSAVLPKMDLTSQNTSMGAGTIDIMFSDIGFLNSPKSFMDAIGGTSFSDATTVTFKLWADAGNVLFGQSILLGSYTGHPTGGAFGGTFPATYTAASPFSLTMEVIITHTAGGTSSFDAQENPVPDSGTTLLLLGAVVSGLAFLRRRFVS